MNRDEYNQKTKEAMLAVNDQAKLSEILTELSDGYAAIASESDQLKKEKESLASDNEKLRDTNHRLFLRVGYVPEPEKPKQEKAPEVDLDELIKPFLGKSKKKASE